MQPITINLRNLADRFIGNLGYVKADAIPRRFSADDLFTGETVIGDTARFAHWDDDKWERLAIASPWVFSDIQLISQEISGGTFQVEQRDGKASEGWSQVTAHPFEEIIERKPNPYMGQSFAWQYAIRWLLLRGEAYWLLIPDGNGELLHMYPLPANRVRPLPSSRSGELYDGFHYWPRDNMVSPDFIPVEQVCFHRFPNPWDYRRGLSPITACRLALQSDDQAARLGLEDLENGLTLRSVISLRSDIRPNEFERARKKIEEGQKAGQRYLVTPAGEIKVEPLSISQRDAEFLTSREFNRDEIDRIYGIPTGFWTDRANRSNSEQAVNTFREFTIWPLMELLAEDLTVQVIDRYYGEMLRGKFDDIRPVNQTTEIEKERNDRETMTYNEARAVKGLDPHPDDDVGNAPFQAAPEIAKLKVQQGFATQQAEAATEAAAARAEIEREITEDAEEDEAVSEDQTDEGQDVSGSEAESTKDEPETDEKALRTDLGRWKSVALREFKKGKAPYLYDFQSDHISLGESERIRSLLQEATTEEAVKAVFTKATDPFVPAGAESYRENLPPVNHIIELAQSEVDDYLAEFDERQPEFETLLDVEIE